MLNGTGDRCRVWVPIGEGFSAVLPLACGWWCFREPSRWALPCSCPASTACAAGGPQ
jgi:hypothetical protein